MDSKELIKSIEDNFHQYYRLLNKLQPEAMEANSIGEAHQLRDFLLTIASIQDEVLDYRLHKILQLEHPYIPKIHVEAVKRKRYSRFSVNQLSDVFLKQRKELIKLLYALPKEDWHRTGLHELEGHITFKELIRRIAEKDKQALGMLSEKISG